MPEGGAYRSLARVAGINPLPSPRGSPRGEGQPISDLARKAALLPLYQRNSFDLARKPALLPLSPLQLLRSGERVAPARRVRVRGCGKCALIQVSKSFASCAEFAS
jgi:hypothetical protein